ncbi:glycosyltransferase [Paraburkholderia sp. GAS32]|uniref:glycosyltransferase n=1 Tax=Paraburkholderia sp. GAS32 TaxID=3035129 RepID=UPI003D1A4C3A
MKIHWIMGPYGVRWNGVGSFSEKLCESLNSAVYVVERHYFRGQPRSFARYFDQFFLIPFRVFFLLRSDHAVILYQEDICFMLWLFMLKTEKLIVVLHHIPSLKNSVNFLEKLKLVFVRINLIALKKAKIVVCPSNSTSSDAKKFVTPEKLTTVPNAFNISSKNSGSIASGHARTDLGRIVGRDLDNYVVILNVGSEETRKNVLTLLRGLSGAIASKPILFLKIGKPVDVTNRREIVNFLSSAPYESCIIDYVEKETLSLAYRSADIFAAPSLYEGFGRTPIEAQAFGVPVCASKLEIFDETMGESYFSVLQPENPHAWTSALAQLLNDESLKRNLIALGYENVKRYDVSRVVGSFEKILSEI